MQYKNLGLDTKFLVLILDNELLSYDTFLSKLCEKDLSQKNFFDKDIFLNFMYLNFFNNRIYELDKNLISNYKKNLDIANKKILPLIEEFKLKKDHIYNNLQKNKVQIEKEYDPRYKNQYHEKNQEKLLFLKDFNILMENIPLRAKAWEDIINDFVINDKNNKYDNIQKEQLKILIKTNYVNELNRFVRAMIFFQTGF